MSQESKGNSDNRVVGPIDVPEDNVTQPRQPQNLQDLLRYSVEAQTGATRAFSRVNQPLDPERRKFLEEALSSMTVDIVKELTAALEVLHNIRNDNITPDDLPSYEAALDTISEHVEFSDFANDFYKLGGFKILSDCLKSSHSSLRWRAADIIALCTQNNPACQKYALDDGFLPVLINLTNNDPDDQCKTKAIYAISCTVRHSDLGLKHFSDQDGFSFLVNALQSNVEKVRTKAAFLLSSIVSQNSQKDIKNNLCKMGFVEQLVLLIRGEHTNTHEHMLSALLSLVTDHQGAQEECSRPELQLHTCLTNLTKELANQEAFQEEVAYIQQILKLVFTMDAEEER